MLKIMNSNDDSSKNYIENKMFEYNMEHFPEHLRGRYQEIHLYLQDEEGQVRGGVLGETCWNWLEIRYLYIDPEVRGVGYGKRLMEEVQQIAINKQCDFIKVDTLSFQALDFYKKEGFEVYGMIENAGTYTHYYMKKDLAKNVN
ncbi:putative acetyltransferase [compost metagenome]